VISRSTNSSLAGNPSLITWQFNIALHITMRNCDYTHVLWWAA